MSVTWWLPQSAGPTGPLLLHPQHVHLRRFPWCEVDRQGRLLLPYWIISSGERNIKTSEQLLHANMLKVSRSTE